MIFILFSIFNFKIFLIIMNVGISLKMTSMNRGHRFGILENFMIFIIFLFLFFIF